MTVGFKLTDDIRLPFEASTARSVSFEPRAGRVSPRQVLSVCAYNHRIACAYTCLGFLDFVALLNDRRET